MVRRDIMEKRVCPKCKEKLNELDEICPKCGEIIFSEVIEVKEISDELLEETIDDLIQEENIIIQSLIKSFIYIVNKLKFWGIKIKSGVTHFFKKILANHVYKLAKKIKSNVKRIIINKVLVYITYERFLAVSIVISSLFLVGICLRNFIYMDNKSEVAQINEESTSGNIQKLYNNTGNVSIDVSDGTVVYTYEKQTVGNVNDCTVYYKINPSTNKVVDMYIVYDKNLFDTRKMRSYLLVNYGEPENKKYNVVWSYENEELLYSFTNGVYDYDREEVHIRYKKNEPTNEELKSYGIIASDNDSLNDSLAEETNDANKEEQEKDVDKKEKTNNEKDKKDKKDE